MRILLLFLVRSVFNCGLTKADDSFSIGGYLPDYRFYINVNDTATKLSDLVLFSLQPSKNGVDFPCCLDNHHYDIARQAVAHKRTINDEDVRLWITVGGGGRSTEFLKATENDAFLQSIQQLATSNMITGIDLDCEYFTSQADYQKYLIWLDRVIPKLQQRNLKVSVALHAGMFLTASIYEKVDRIHLMTYDMMYDRTSMAHRPEDHYHADMYQTDQAVQKLVKSGCPRAKIILGIPAYARHYQKPAMVKTFAELVDEIMSEETDRAMSVLKEWKGYRGDFPISAARKVDYARQQQLGGVFLWELGQDKQVDGNGGYLLETISAAASNTGVLNNKEEL
jgi:GH18 family chitinase